MWRNCEEISCGIQQMNGIRSCRYSETMPYFSYVCGNSLPKYPRHIAGDCGESVNRRCQLVKKTSSMTQRSSRSFTPCRKVNQERLEYLRRSKDYSDAIRNDVLKSRPNSRSRNRETSKSSLKTTNKSLSRDSVKSEAVKTSVDKLSTTRNTPKVEKKKQIRPDASQNINKNQPKIKIISFLNKKNTIKKANYMGNEVKVEKKINGSNMDVGKSKIENKFKRKIEKQDDKKVNKLTHKIGRNKSAELDITHYEGESLKASLPEPVINFDENSTEIEENLISDEETSIKLNDQSMTFQDLSGPFEINTERDTDKMVEKMQSEELEDALNSDSQEVINDVTSKIDAKHEYENEVVEKGLLNDSAVEFYYEMSQGSRRVSNTTKILNESSDFSPKDLRKSFRESLTIFNNKIGKLFKKDANEKESDDSYHDRNDDGNANQSNNKKPSYTKSQYDLNETDKDTLFENHQIFSRNLTIIKSFNDISHLIEKITI